MLYKNSYVPLRGKKTSRSPDFAFFLLKEQEKISEAGVEPVCFENCFWGWGWGACNMLLNKHMYLELWLPLVWYKNMFVLCEEGSPRGVQFRRNCTQELFPAYAQGAVLRDTSDPWTRKRGERGTG